MHIFIELDYSGVNLALNKPATQSSTYSSGVASLAVDGLYAGAACTLDNVHPYWTVDLGLAYDIGHVTVTNDAAIYRKYCHNIALTVFITIVLCDNRERDHYIIISVDFLFLAKFLRRFCSDFLEILPYDV